MPKRMHQNNPAYRWFFENRFRLSETSERFRRSTDMRSGWTMHSRSLLVLSIPLLKFLRLDAYYLDKSPMPITIHPTKCLRPIARPSKPLDRWRRSVCNHRSQHSGAVHPCSKKATRCAGDEGELRPAVPQDRRLWHDHGSVCVVRAAW